MTMGLVSEIISILTLNFVTRMCSGEWDSLDTFLVVSEFSNCVGKEKINCCRCLLSVLHFINSKNFLAGPTPRGTSSSSSSVMTATNVSWSVSGQGDLHQLSLTSSSGDHFPPIGWGCYMLYLKSSSDNFSASCCPDHSLMAASLSIDASLQGVQ